MAEKPPPPDALGPTRPLAPPLYQSSVYTLPDLDALDRVTAGEEPGFIYLRDTCKWDIWPWQRQFSKLWLFLFLIDCSRHRPGLLRSHRRR